MHVRLALDGTATGLVCMNTLKPAGICCSGIAPGILQLNLKNFFTIWRPLSKNDMPYLRICHIVLSVSLPQMIWCVSGRQKKDWSCWNDAGKTSFWWMGALRNIVQSSCRVTSGTAALSGTTKNFQDGAIAWMAPIYHWQLLSIDQEVVTYELCCAD